MKEFQNKVIVITGGAGGIGRTIAMAFLRQGGRVVLVDNRARHLMRIIVRFKKEGYAVTGILGDVSRPGNVRAFIKQITRNYGTIDVLVNCAGIQKPIGAFAGVSMTEWLHNIEVNLFGTVLCCKEVLPGMIKKRRGVIINFSGGGATSSRPNFSAYAVAKTGIVRFTEILAKEVAHYGIRINAVSPGAVNTRMLSEVLRSGEKAGKKEIKEALERKSQGGTPPEKAAELVLFLSSKKAAGLTGKLISAAWDDWRNWSSKEIREISQSDIYNLRRKIDK